LHFLLHTQAATVIHCPTLFHTEDTYFAEDLISWIVISAIHGKSRASPVQFFISLSPLW